ncbi:MAG: GH39 family glycosyl hydrolase [Bdellovibrio sp.]
MEKIQFFCNLTGSTNPLKHSWEHTIGSGRAELALRADWQKQLKRCHEELGIQHVRFHGLLSDDMGTLVCQNNNYVYSFFNADQIFDYLQSIGMRPFMELSFMPTTLASGSETVFHYKGNVTPPKDFEAWAVLIEKMVNHFKNRYGTEEVAQWFFEVWNEPNLKAFWTGDQKQYFELYHRTAKAIKGVDSQFKVGGPATAMNEWVHDFLQYAMDNDVPVDFISTHQYPTDSFGKPGDDTIKQLSLSRRSVLKEQVLDTFQKAKGKPIYYTEWSTSSNPFDDLHDSSYCASAIIKTVLEVSDFVQGYSYWTFSDIFEENYFSSVPFHGGFGLLNIYGIPKPAYRAFELLHKLGSEKLTVEGKHETVDVWITKKENIYKVMMTNWNLPMHPIKTELVEIRLDGMEKIKTVYAERIDDDNANSYQEWIRMGKPETLSDKEVRFLDEKSSLSKQSIAVEFEQHTALLTIRVPPQGVVCITLEV